MAEDFSKLNGHLENLLSKHHANQLILPFLKKEKTFWESMWEKIDKWVEKMMPKFDSDSGLTPALVETVLKVAAEILAAMVIVYLLVSLYRLFRRNLQAAENLSQAPSKGGAPLDPLALLKQELSSAIEGKFFSRASRLRWKLFLLRTGVHIGTTPYEFQRKSRESSGAFALPMENLYRLMFGVPIDQPVPLHENDYSTFDSTLSTLEKRGRSSV